ncbi:hypothetical protein LG634_09460 [Streptomyces bambusae]|uniref:hypothetical protein n=1 Tax=Streptomyces bambusae TaxID=1550616 RepID=UPI001CFE7E7E|nr:hypothetical protein [Streptomyces bambusae]MCB5165054.1 hypothetical protein [Streptomyces bambusae]
MDRVVDLDEVAGLLVGAAARWQAIGLDVGPLTWRDAEAEWPQPLGTDRAAVWDPDSLGVVVVDPAGAELSVVLFRGGWADVDFMAGPYDAGCLPASDISSASDFAGRMERWVERVFGVSG